MSTADVAKTHAVQPGSRVTGATSSAARLPSLRPMKNGCCRSSSQNTAGTGWNRTTGRWVNPRTFPAVPAAFGAVNPAAGRRGGCRGDGALLPQPLRFSGDPQNIGAGRAQLRRLIVGQWLMVLALSAVTGGAIGLLFEKLLMVLLKPVLPAALPPPASGRGCGPLAR